MSALKFDVSVVGELNLDLVLYGLPMEFEFDRERQGGTEAFREAAHRSAFLNQ